MKNGIVEFYGQELITARSDKGVEYVAMKPLCENLGLDWRGQYQRMLRDDVLSQGVCMINTPTKGGEQKLMFLPAEFLNGWLFGVDTSRLKDEAVKQKIIVYKKECFKVLHTYWSKSSTSVEDRLDRLEVMVQTMSDGFKELSGAFKDVASAMAQRPTTTNVMMGGSPFLALNRSLSDDPIKRDRFIKAVILTLEKYPDGISQTELIYQANYSQSESTRRWLQENIGIYWDMFIVPGNKYRYISKQEVLEANS